jgi:starch phosphorylase
MRCSRKSLEPGLATAASEGSPRASSIRSTLEIPTLAYGIRYEFGIFQQDIVDGWQVEKTDKWLTFGNPWRSRGPSGPSR